MGDPGVVPGAIGVGIQMLVSKMIEWIKRAACCKKELDKLKDLLRFNLSIYEQIRINANKIGSLPDPVDEWLTQLKEILQNGSQFVEACTLPPGWQIPARNNLTKDITRFTSDLRDHLASNSLIISLQQLHLGAAIEQLRRELESLKQSISPPDDFQGLPHQIVEEEERLLWTVSDSQEFSCDDERSNALLKVHIKRGTNLAVRDKYWKKSSDQYVVAILNDQEKKTKVIRKNLNPVWNEELSLPLQEPHSLLLKLKVYDEDRLSRDDPMGYAEVDLSNLARAARILRTTQLPSLATMNTGGLRIECVDGHMVQKVCLKLNRVESGELYLHIKWVDMTN